MNNQYMAISKIKRLDKFGHVRIEWLLEDGRMILPSKHFGHLFDLRFKGSKFIIHNGLSVESYHPSLKAAKTRIQ